MMADGLMAGSADGCALWREGGNSYLLHFIVHNTIIINIVNHTKGNRYLPTL